MIETIQFLCSDIWVDLKTLSTILKRDPTALQIHYISKMLAEGLLELKYPETKNHPLQAYKSKDT